MSQVTFTPDQQARLQVEVQQELERREWAEPDDNVMAEYIAVLLANGNTQERVHTEMDDLVGADFDPGFLDWLFAKAQELGKPPSPAPSRSPVTVTQPVPARGSSRLLDTALAPLSQPEKRKLEGAQDGGSKRRISDGIPSGPRGMTESRSLADRLGPSRGGARGRMPVRGVAGGRMQNNIGGNVGMGMNQMGGFQGGSQRNGMAQQGPGFFPPGQQEMMAQMMMMQVNMAQMGEMMHKMVEEKEQAAIAQPVQPVRPVRPPTPAKIPHGTKLGSHSVSAVPPKRSSSPGPIPDKPTSQALCKYSVGCSNSRCSFSHPSPVADEKTGMVLSEEACEVGKNCKDAECTKSHVSPAATLGGTAGPSRMLCKYQNCTNPSCAFRHEDENGNSIPPPALTAAKASKEAKAKKIEISAPAPNSDNDDGDVEVVVSSKSLMDGALEGGKTERPCRYAKRCTRPDCKFTHPPGRAAPKSKYPFSRPAVASNGLSTMGFNKSKKFGAGGGESKLDPKAGDFKPAAEVA